MKTTGKISGMNMTKFAALIIAGLLHFQVSTAQSNLMGSGGIMEKLLKMVDIMEARGGLEVVRIEADVVGTVKETIRTLDPKYTHTIVAVAGDQIKDIGIEVYRKANNDWVLVEKEDDMTAAVVAISPSAMEEYKIVVRARQFAPGFSAGHYGLIFIVN